LPLVRYGWVGGLVEPAGPLLVMFDGELAGETVHLDNVEQVSITTLVIHLEGTDLVENAELRRALVGLWRAEADEAGLAIDSMHAMGDGLRDSSEGWALAEIMSAGEPYVLRVATEPNQPGMISLRADPPNRWPV
jgi:hypothetical protein